MSTFIRVFCRGRARSPKAELASFVCDGVFFADGLAFEPPDALERTTGGDRASLHVFHEPDRRPVVLWRTSGGTLLQDDVGRAGSGSPPRVDDRDLCA